ncbi:alpha/beta fold hydrolase [Pseudorhodoferax sp.]|uniref:alpha/beta fold hydrolase n=1 Tax=Pseudorhodoferax sp. TaxID=1993553 RepID=UPI002DD651A5|nr:alpha/beta fold hydrolase [Pseudorhodoferax sp.]
MTGIASRAGPRTYVLMHGGFHGGWCWRDVAERLRAAGHRVTTPTQTGMGERRHLLSRDLTLDTFAMDLVNHLVYEEIDEAILVGHSFGGCALSGAADRVPERIRHLVYLDALVLQDGESAFGVMPPDIVAARRKTIAEEGEGLFWPVAPVTAFGVPLDHPRAQWLAERLSPQPASTYDSPMRLRHPVGNGLPRTYVACTEPPYAPLAPVRAWVQAQPDWQYLELATGHDAMVLAPDALAELLLRIG